MAEAGARARATAYAGFLFFMVLGWVLASGGTGFANSACEDLGEFQCEDTFEVVWWYLALTLAVWVGMCLVGWYNCMNDYRLVITGFLAIAAVSSMQNADTFLRLRRSCNRAPSSCYDSADAELSIAACGFIVQSIVNLALIVVVGSSDTSTVAWALPSSRNAFHKATVGRAVTGSSLRRSLRGRRPQPIPAEGQQLPALANGATNNFGSGSHGYTTSVVMAGGGAVASPIVSAEGNVDAAPHDSARLSRKHHRRFARQEDESEAGSVMTVNPMMHTGAAGAASSDRDRPLSGDTASSGGAGAAAGAATSTARPRSRPPPGGWKKVQVQTDYSAGVGLYGLGGLGRPGPVRPAAQPRPGALTQPAQGTPMAGGEGNVRLSQQTPPPQLADPAQATATAGGEGRVRLASQTPPPHELEGGLDILPPLEPQSWSSNNLVV